MSLTKLDVYYFLVDKEKNDLQVIEEPVKKEIIKTIEDLLDTLNYDYAYNKIKKGFEELTSGKSKNLIRMIFSKYYNYYDHFDYRLKPTEYPNPKELDLFYTKHDIAKIIYERMYHSKYEFVYFDEDYIKNNDYFIKCNKIIEENYYNKIQEIIRKYKMINAKVDNFKTGVKAAKWLKEEFNFDVKFDAKIDEIDRSLVNLRDKNNYDEKG